MGSPRFNGKKSDGLHSICDSLYKRNEETSFLKQVVTGMKNGSFTIMLSEKDLGESGMNHL